MSGLHRLAKADEEITLGERGYMKPFLCLSILVQTPAMGRCPSFMVGCSFARIGIDSFRDRALVTPHNSAPVFEQLAKGAFGTSCVSVFRPFSLRVFIPMPY
jgi:hypothetical protein